jgi:predicted transcriptional regulator
MKKTSLYLDAALDRRLAQLAAEDGVTKAEYIRRALRDRAEASERRPIRAIGVGAGPGDVAEDVDRHLAETGFAT